MLLSRCSISPLNSKHLMPSSPTPSPESFANDAEFIQRIQADPAFAAQVRADCEAALANPRFREEPAAEPMRVLVAWIKCRQGLAASRAHMMDAMKILSDPESLFEPEVRDRVTALLDEASDAALDVREPERTDLVNRITALRSQVAQVFREHL